MRFKIVYVSVLFLLITANLLADDSFTYYLDRNRLNEVTDLTHLPESLNKEILDKLPLISWMQSNSYTILPLQGDIYALRNGFFDVLIWNDTSWVNMYRGHYFGYNFGAKTFTYKNEIYSLGGYGYWQTHSNLLQFDRELGTWKMISTINKPLNYTSYCVGKIDDTILTLFGETRDESSNYCVAAKNGYYLNLENLEWNEVSYDNKVQPQSPLIIGKKYLDLQDYIVFETQLDTKLGLYIINKSNLSVNFWNRGEHAISLSPFVLISNNTITYQRQSSELSVIDFGKISQNEITLGSIHLETSYNLPLFWFFAVAGMLLILLPLIYFTIKYFKIARLNNNGNNHDDDPIEYLTEKLLKRKGEIIDLQDLNKLLEIDSLTFESRRAKRSKLISEINKRFMVNTGNNLIIRKRNNKDKRYIKYEIGGNNQ